MFAGVHERNGYGLARKLRPEPTDGGDDDDEVVVGDDTRRRRRPVASTERGRRSLVLTGGMRRVLVLGGTAWLGKEIARAAVSSQATVVCLARGVSGAVPDGARLVRADRTMPGAYDQLEGEWDEVVELAYEPGLVNSALDALADRAHHWTLVSSVSVYRRNDEPGADESAALVEPHDLTDYAQAKVAAEGAARSRLDDRLLIVRPGLIAGPGDPTDRFGYWMARLHRGGRVLTPTAAGRSVQVIDVADLAAWIVEAGGTNLTGVVNAVGESHEFESFLGEVRSVTGFAGELVAVDDAWLVQRDVRFWAGPRSLPLWIPAADTAFAQRSNATYRAAGGITRPLHDTIARTRDDEVARGAQRPRRSGLTPDEEADLLEQMS